MVMRVEQITSNDPELLLFLVCTSARSALIIVTVSYAQTRQATPIVYHRFAGTEI
jgi:hypothetical protein